MASNFLLFSFFLFLLLGRSSHSEYHFSVSSLPSGGKCVINPSNGTSIKTIFYISCAKWTSRLGSLYYRILFKTAFSDGVISYQLLSYGPKESFELILPHGHKEDNYFVNITVEVEDIYQTFTTVELQTQVFLIEFEDSSFYKLIIFHDLLHIFMLKNFPMKVIQ